MSKTFCILPWMHLATTSTGNLRVCCNSVPGDNLIRKEDGTPYKLFKDDIQEAWTSETYNTIREQLLNGDRPKMCERCFREEDSGIRSARQNWNSKWQEQKEYELIPTFNIKYVDLRLSNLCNLKCRMCNPYSSNMWVKEWGLVEDALSESEYNRLKTMSWPEDDKTWENLFSIAHTVEEIYLTGGEPTIIKEQHRLLDYFIDNNTAKNIKLKYNTNLTNVPQHLVDKWKEFKSVQLNCSIDAVGELDRYIRYPSNWKTIEKNFKVIRQLENANIEIHCTVQMYNILRLNELIDWATPYGHKIYFNILNHPKYLNIRCLPDELKKQASDMLLKYTHLPKVQGIIDYMNAEDWTEHLPKFKEYTKALDISRNECISTVIPELDKL
jgi:MoaA/NifB/PqqE/SkfB family radical SAM enzyme